jgi:hypothetical protein
MTLRVVRIVYEEDDFPTSSDAHPANRPRQPHSFLVPNLERPFLTLQSW